MLVQILIALNGNPQTGEPGIKQLIQGLQMQNDTLIRMDAGEVSRQEVKRRIQKADAAVEAQQEAAEAAARAEAEAEGTVDIGGEG